MVHKLIAKGLAEHQAGRLYEAQIIYKQVLSIDPRHPDAFHLLGVIALQRGIPVAPLAYWFQQRQHAPPRRDRPHREGAGAMSAGMALDGHG